MTYTNIGICSNALLKIGAEGITSFEDGTADYSIEGYELVVDENGDPVHFENASFWIYAETDYESKVDGSASFYLRGMEGPRDAVYGPFEGNLVELLP